MEALKEAIRKTLAFYGIFEFPLTPLEILKNLEISVDLAGVMATLRELEAEGKILKKDGYFFLPQEKDLAVQRKARFLISFTKLRRAKRLAKLFSFFPFVKFAGACNSLGYWNARPESDIDFFIIAKSGRIWTARFLTTLFLKIFGLRPAARETADKFCLSFYAADDALDISPAALPDGDPYFYRWFNWITPLYDDGVWRGFVSANGWIKNHLPNFFPQDAIKASGQPFFKKAAEKLFFIPENFFRKIQLSAMPDELKSATGRGDGSVIMSDRMLKFHLLDRRKEYKENYESRIKN
jgi:hypothetical protein